MCENNEFIEKLNNQLKSAYRKYKTNVYYNTYDAIPRAKLSEFEYINFKDKNTDETTSHDFNEKFEEYFENFAHELSENFDDVIDNIIDKIGIISTPKKINGPKHDEQIISNISQASSDVSKIHYFIDLPIEGQILGVLWILRCGYVLDDRLYEHCYANRLNSVLLENLKNEDYGEKCEFTPFLFQPYYQRYQSWRDNGLDSVKKLLNENQDAIMFSLDFQDYYYRSLIDFNDLIQDIERTETKLKIEKSKDDKKFDDKLNKYIRKVFEKYSEKFNRSEKDEYPMIPLGFLPSLIIANWNLQGFDKVILNNVNPFYYGRYVDDVLIVFGLHKKSESYEDPEIDHMNVDSILRKYFTDEPPQPYNDIIKFNEDSENSSNEDDDEDKKYGIYNQPLFKESKNEFHYENLTLQKKKLRIYKFSNKYSDAIIENFKKEIRKNSSEFKLLHDFDAIIDELDDKLYQIEYKDSINKLNSIKDVRINKFEISKELSRINIASKNIKFPIDEEPKNKIITIFKQNTLEFMSLWEKAFSLLYINEYNDDLWDLIDEIINVINNIKIVDKKEKDKKSKENKDYYYSIRQDKRNLKKSLFKTLYSSLIRTLSLRSFKYDDKVEKTLKNLFLNLKRYDKLDIDINNINEIKMEVRENIKQYLFASMQNNILMKYPLQDTSKIICEMKSYNLIKPKNNFYGYYKGIYPRFIKYNEVVLNEINRELYQKKNENPIEENDKLKEFLELLGVTIDFEDYIKKAFKKYYIYNFGHESPNKKIFSELDRECELECDYDECPNKNESCEIIKIGSKRKNKIKIGLVNVNLSQDDFENRVKNRPNLSQDRLGKIQHTINEAIQKEVDLLIMPECYIPIEWINELLYVSKNHQIAMIFGLEPILTENNVGNYIMATWPFKISDKYHETLLTYRLKNHYAPGELETYKENDKEEITSELKYYLFNWNGIYIAPYYCYEIADLKDRSLFKSCCDIVTVSEFNKDTIYFDNIAESLSRDLFCYCIKSNTAEFGGNEIIQPASSESKYLVKLKGGDDYIVTCELDIKKLREEAIKNDEYSKKREFKPKPPGFNRDVVKKRMGLM